MAKRSTVKSQLEVNSLLDCTKACSSKQHAEIILSTAYLGNLKLLQHCDTVCGNYLRIRDSFGRNALHVAASKGHSRLVEWLLNKKKVKVNLTDLESKWSALHRSMFYGQLGISAQLVKAGGDLNLRDDDGTTPLSILNEDRERFKSRLSIGAVNVYTWGSNSNVTLGHDHSRKYPEKLEFPQNYVISQVVLCKFHSVLLTEDGKVFTCGHGLGGRLGHDSEQSMVVPCLVKAVNQFVCVSIAAARNHTVILTKSGSVLTCGLNDAHQLGQGSNPSTAPPTCLVPKAVRTLKNKHVIAIGAGRYHTALCTSNEVYTMGRNLGQLGYEKNYDTQISPRAVPGVNLDPGDSITHLSASDAATACLTKRHRIFVCTASTVKTIRCVFLEKSSCLQFCVCASLSDLDHLRKVESEPTKVLMLDSRYNLRYWEPTKRGSVPNHVPGLARHKVAQFCLGKRLSIVTKQGDVYSGLASLSKKPLELSRLLNIQNARAIFTDFKASNFAFTQQVYSPLSLPELSASTLTADLTALLEEACLPGSVSDLEIKVGDQVFTAHRFIFGSASPELAALLKSSSSLDRSPNTPQKRQHSPSSQTVSIKCDNSSVFEAFLHYIYGSHIRLLPPASVTPHSSQLHPPPSSQLHPHHSSQVEPPLPSQLLPSQNGPLSSASSSGLSGPTSSTTSLDGESTTCTPDTSFASMDDNDLTAVYDQFASSNGVDQFEDIEVPIHLVGSTPKKKSVSSSLRQKHVAKPSDGDPQKFLQLINPRADLKALLQLATTFGVSKLAKDLEDLLSSQVKRHLLKSLVLISPKPDLKYDGLCQFSDLILKSRDGDSLHCHRCVLVARSDYFRSMLLMGWRESSDSVKSLSLPVGTTELKAVLEYLYTDNSPAVTGSTSLEWIVSVLVVADQLLLTRLKDLCEKTLTNSLSLRTVAEMLDLAEAYSASQLKKSCLHFISANAACLLEGRLLDSVDPSLLDELSTTYQELAPFVTKRVIKFPEPELSSLPESYFLEDITEGLKVSGDEACDGESPIQSFSSVHEVESIQTPSVNQEALTPRASTTSSGTRKKRRRKTSQSESKRNAGSNTSNLPQSPTRTSISPVDTTPIANTWSAKPSSDSRQTPKESVSGHSTPQVDYNSTPVECQSGNSVSSTPGSGINGWTEKVARSGKRSQRSSKARTNLFNKFNTSPSEGSNVLEDSKGLTNSLNGMASHLNGKNSSHDVIREVSEDISVANSMDRTAPKRPWAQASPSTSNPSSTMSSFKEIMAREEQILQRNRQAKQKSPPPDATRPHPAHVSSSIPINRRHSNSQESPLQSPSSISQSPSVNPWKSSSSQQGTSPTVSLRELMIEAEATQRREKQQQRQARVARTSSSTKQEERVGRHQPVVVPHQQVSFASIVRAQELEHDKSRCRTLKPLPLIQIEERAILELKEKYCSRDNPDEFITVESVPVGSKLSIRNGQQGAFTVRQHSQDSPWGRDTIHA